MTINLEALRTPFRPDEVEWRLGAMTADKTRAMALAYVDARVVQDRFDEACGLDGWQCRYSQADTKTVCEIGVRCGNEWLWRADGAGDSDIEAAKGALSDAFKRAAVRWGVGRYLYDVESPWVDVVKDRGSYKIKDSEKDKLARVLMAARPALTAPEPKRLPAPVVAGRVAYLADARDGINEATTRADIAVVIQTARADRARVGLTDEDITALVGIGEGRAKALRASRGYSRDGAMNGHAAAN